MCIDLELYRIFYQVVKYKNISKTAENIYVSQSAITQSIKKLEQMLGGKVFFRTKYGVELTEEGKNLYNYIKDSIEKMNNAEKIFSRYVNLEKGAIRIGGGNSLVNSLLLEPFCEFAKKYPDIDVSIVSGKTDDLVKKLANGELDIVALNLPYLNKNYSNVEILPLRKCSFCFFASKKYIKNNKIRSFKDVLNHKIILPKQSSSKRKIVNDYCERKDILVESNYEVSSSSVMKKMVLNDVGIGFIKVENLEDIKDKVKIIKKIEDNKANEGIAVLNKNMSNKATLELIEEIKNFYDKK